MSQIKLTGRIFASLLSLKTKVFSKISLSKIYKKWYCILLAAMLIVSIIISITGIDFAGDMESRAWDYYYRIYPGDDHNTDNIVIVTIDDSSLEFFVKNGISWPWPRDFYAHVVDYFNEGGAKAVLLDILFYEPDLDRFDVDAEITDNRFATALKNYNKSVLAALMLPDSTVVRDNLDVFHIPIDERMKNTIRSFKGIRAPIDILLENSEAIGTVNVFPDNDGIVRRVPLYLEAGDIVIPQLSLGALLIADNEISSQSINMHNDKWYFKGDKIPVDKAGNYLINWYGKEGPQGVFQYYSFRSVIQSASAYQRGLEPLLYPETFEDKYVIIGATAPGLRDLVPTPISQTHPGMEVWATVLNNFVEHDFVRLTPSTVSILYLLSISVILMFMFVYNPLRIGNLLIILLVIIIIALPLVLWLNFRMQLPIISPTATFVLSFMYITLVSYVSEGKSKREIKKAFGRYLHPQIIEQLVENPGLVDLEGHEFEATMLFTDIYDFTTFSENIEPKALISLLNKYFESITSNILDDDGMLDKFMGDGLMAVFGAPLVKPDHALKACRSALSHKKEWQRYFQVNKDVKDHSAKFHLLTRIGINSGPVVAGNIGSIRRVDYTVIGDAVNLAARLESINKYYSTDIIISDFTHNNVKDMFICRELDYMKVKGKSKPTRIYELIDFKDSPEESYQWIDDYLEALYYYRQGAWDKAINLFNKLCKQPVNDKVSEIMIDRCLFLKDNPPQNWDGIYKWEVK